MAITKHSDGNIMSVHVSKKSDPKPEEKVEIELTPEEQIVADIRSTVVLLNGTIETAAQMGIQTELTSIDITNVDSNCTLMGHFVKLSKIL